MTYGQTVGLTHDTALIGNWAALRWGMLGLAIKGSVWIGFAGFFLGLGLGSGLGRPGPWALGPGPCLSKNVRCSNKNDKFGRRWPALLTAPQGLLVCTCVVGAFSALFQRSEGSCLGSTMHCWATGLQARVCKRFSNDAPKPVFPFCMSYCVGVLHVFVLMCLPIYCRGGIEY